MESVKPRSDEIPDDLTQRMIDIGGAMLADHGVGGLSLRKLATAAGTSTMSVYTRFGSKQALLAAMYREGFRRLGAALAVSEQTSDVVTDSAPIQILAAAGLGYRRAALASPTLYGLMFGPVPPGLTPSAEDDLAASATYEPLTAGIRAAVDAGVLAGDPERIALHLWTVAHGAVSLELAGRIDVGEQAEELYLESLAFAVAPFVVARTADAGGAKRPSAPVD